MQNPITIIFIIISLLASLKGFKDQDFMSKWINWPYKINTEKQYYRLLSGGFLHGDYLHLFVNLFVLYQFGLLVESYYSQVFGMVNGKIFYTLLLLLGIAVPDLVTYLREKDNPGYRSLGASGAVSAVLFAYVLFDPWSKMYLYGIIPMYSFVAAILYIIYSIWADRRGGDNVNHMAHISGAVFGFLFTGMLRPEIFVRFIDQLSSVF